MISVLNQLAQAPAGSVWISWNLLILALMVFIVSAVFLTILDLREHRLPNILTGILGVGGLVLLAGVSLAGPDTSRIQVAGVPAGIGSMLVCGVGYFLVMLVLNLLSRGGLGMGDVKLAFGLGVYTGWIGWETTVLAAVAGFVIGGLIALVLMLTRRADRSTQIPFGPAMILGAVLAMLG